MFPRREPDTRLALGAFFGFGIIALVFLIFIAVLLLYKGGLAFGGKKVAVITIDGPITVKGEEPTLFDKGRPGSADYARVIEELNKRDDVGALVVVINSPGGSVVASREIYDALKAFKKPKVAYLYEIATSGGYYVACGTDYIVAHPDTLTGSIGVVALFPSFKGLFDKLGINVTVVKSGRYKDIGSSFRDMDPKEYELLKGVVDEIFEEFKSVVLSARKGKVADDVYEVFDARILTGRQAKRYGLVDELGTEQDAIKKAAEMAGIKGEPKVMYVNVVHREFKQFELSSMLAGFVRLPTHITTQVEVRYE
jgi:protease-4